MREYIKKLQTKNEQSRKQILFVTLAICMSLVIGIWVYTLTSSFDEKVQAKASDDIKPFALLGDSISNTYKNITASVGSISSVSNSNPKEITDQSTEKQIDLIVVDKQANQ